jgi:hypothetical protein
MELQERLCILEFELSTFKTDLELLLSGDTENVAPDEISFTVDQINRVEKEIASIQDAL